jgi:hypothetical protein
MVLDLVAILLRVVRHRHPLVLGSFVHSIERPDALSGALCFSGGEPSAQPGENKHTHTPIQSSSDRKKLPSAAMGDSSVSGFEKPVEAGSRTFVCVCMCACVYVCVYVFFFSPV